jgi:hypothetical protein
MGPRLAGCLLLLSTATAFDFAFPDFPSFQGMVIMMERRKGEGCEEEEGSSL